MTASRRGVRALALGVGVSAVGALGLAAHPPRATATTFGAPAVASAQGSTQASSATSPVISGDGDYVVFDGIFDGVPGVYRKDLATGELDLVAGQTSDPVDDAPDAGSPSVSADGRYVAFTTTADLDPVDDPGTGCSSVYVRDMTIPIGSPGAYTLVSALNGTSQGLTYAGTGAQNDACPGGGSAAADRVAMSADGTEVAFTVLGQSNLTTGPGGATSTPPDQVAVRDLATQQTTLVSQTMASLGSTPEPVPDGAALTTDGEVTSISTNAIANQPSDGSFTVPISASTAAISADGSTVAWMGIDIPGQAPAGAGDAPGGYPAQFAEPLWRQIGAGPDAPTRRVTGGDDPFAPGGQGPFQYQPSNGAGTGDVGPENGTYIGATQGFGVGASLQSSSFVSLDTVTPSLSADGSLVAFLSDQPVAGELTSTSTGSAATAPTDAYLVNMTPGLTRDQALIPITSPAPTPGGENPIDDVLLSPGGTRVALTTERSTFGPGSPALVTAQTGTGALGVDQLYDVDLTADTLSLVTTGYDGQPADGTVQAPSFTADGLGLAFSSSATNLVYGADNGNENAFTLSEVDTPVLAGTSTVGAGGPPAVAITPRWAIAATVRATRAGAAVLEVTVPGAGRLTASATAQVAAPTDRHAGAKTRDVQRSVAAARRTVTTARVDALTLTPHRSLRSLLDARHGLFTTIRVRFIASGHPAQTAVLQVTLHRRPPRHPDHGRPSRKAIR